MSWSDLVVLSHLRWAFVWQRPQHLVSRLATEQRTWFVEEPIVGDVRGPTLRHSRHGLVTQVWLEVPGPERQCGFDDAELTDTYVEELRRLVGWAPRRAVWLYTPMALDVARALAPSFLVYDVMDDLASFKGAPAGLRQRQARTLDEADVVFAGGRSLHAAVARRRPDAHLFPSGVEMEHFVTARSARRRNPKPVAGYVGVVDERIDLKLLGGLAAALPEWEVQVVGPVAKIDPTDLPHAPNLRYLGGRPYAELPSVMAGFDVALMPFALNAATRSISPTKTLEYLAAGLPVVSSRVPDVVADYGGIVALADDAEQFARACRDALTLDRAELDRKVWPLLRRQHWDAIASRMSAVLRHATTSTSAATVAALSSAEESA